MNRGLIDSIGVEGPGFAGWMENRFPGLTGGSGGDDDGDGIANGFEYAFGLNPTQADPPGSAPFPVLGIDTLTLSIPEIARAEDVLVEVDSSSDLSSWNPVSGQISADSIDHVVPITNEPRMFVRSRLTIPE